VNSGSKVNGESIERTNDSAESKSIDKVKVEHERPEQSVMKWDKIEIGKNVNKLEIRSMVATCLAADTR
jgi:hypothetical protein